MAVTKDQVLAKAKELSLSLTEAEVDEHVSKGTLPTNPSEKRYRELKGEFEQMEKDKLIDKLMELSSEAKDHRLKAREYREQLEQVQKELTALKEQLGKHPDLENKFKALETQLQAVKDAEKKRREQALSKIPEDKRATFNYLLNVEAVPSEQFDGTIEYLLTQKSPGMHIPSPGLSPGEANPFSKKSLNLALQVKLKKENPEKAKQLEELAAQEN